MRLYGKVAIVTGGTSGIGEGICKAFAAEGAKVAVAGRNEERGCRIEKEIREKGGEAEFFRTDVTKEEEIVKLIDSALAKWGKLDVLVNNAGIGFSGPLSETSVETWEKVFGTNARAVFLGIKHGIPELLKTQGSLITVSSMGGIKPLPQHYAYSPSKAAATMVTKVAALEYASKGVRCNVICPGVVDTPIIATATEEIKQAVAGSIPAGRLGKPEDIAGIAVYLASDESKWTTGQSFSVDGGSTLL